LPPGPAILLNTFAPNAFLQKAIVADASLWFNEAVTVPYCLGTGLIGFFAAFFVAVFLLALGPLLSAFVRPGGLLARIH
jgi:hypothetical protein